MFVAPSHQMVQVLGVTRGGFVWMSEGGQIVAACTFWMLSGCQLAASLHLFVYFQVSWEDIQCTYGNDNYRW